jgi:hypothetical protein
VVLAPFNDLLEDSVVHLYIYRERERYDHMSLATAKVGPSRANLNLKRQRRRKKGKEEREDASKARYIRDRNGFVGVRVGNIVEHVLDENRLLGHRAF